MLLILIVRNQEADAGENALRQHFFCTNFCGGWENEHRKFGTNSGCGDFYVGTDGSQRINNKIYFSHASAIGRLSCKCLEIWLFICAQSSRCHPPSLLLSPIHNGGKRNWTSGWNGRIFSITPFSKMVWKVIHEAKDNPHFSPGWWKETELSSRCDLHGQGVSPYVSMLDADRIVADFMHEMMKANKMEPWLMNNFYHFELMKTSGLDRRSFVSIYLVQRRSGECPPCFRLTQEFSNAWA